MKYALFLAVMSTSFAWAKPDENLWLKTDSRWTRNDYYGIDRNHNGVIDEDEWVKIQTHGTARQPWNQSRPLQAGETHRWDVEWDETYQSKASQAKGR